MAATIPDCELHWIEGAKTFSMIDRPDELVSIVRPFLEKLSVTNCTHNLGQEPTRDVGI